MEVQHYPTEKMIADFYTKPIQGKQFYKLRSIIMDHDAMPLEECVKNSDKKTTGMGSKKRVSRKTSRLNSSHGYQISNNFK